MRSLSTNPHWRPENCSALSNFADEVSATLARLLAYVGTLAVFGILALHALDEWQATGVVTGVTETAAKPDWRLADHSNPAFSVGQIDPAVKSVSYMVFRHSEGGRKDILRWIGANEATLTELEIYRPGGEFGDSRPTTSLAARTTTGSASELEEAGVVDSKFGLVVLKRQGGSRQDGRGCLDFFKRLDDPVLMISGWSCEGQTLPARRTAIACMLDRLTLLSSGNEPKLAELFARAELRRGPRCADTTASADWVTGAADPRLRGAL